MSEPRMKFSDKMVTYIEKPRLACSRCRLIRVSIGSKRNRKGQRRRLFTKDEGVKREGLVLSTCNSCDGGGRGRAATTLHYVTALLSFPLPMPQKSIFRQPGTKHFQLVHRSQRDPLINDPDASKHVLKPFERENTKKVGAHKFYLISK